MTCMHACMLNHFSCVWLFAIPWSIALQAPLSMGFSKQEYWRVLPCPPPGDLPNPRIEPVSLTSPVLAGRFFTISTTWEAHLKTLIIYLTWYELQRNIAEKVYSRVWLTMYSPKLPLTLSGLHKPRLLLAASCSWLLFAFRQRPQHMLSSHFSALFPVSSLFLWCFPEVSILVPSRSTNTFRLV